MPVKPRVYHSITHRDSLTTTIKINTDEESEKGKIVKTVKFDDLLNVSGPEIVGIDEFLEIEETVGYFGG